MKRTILSLTTAIALASPAFAQDNFDSVIAESLQVYGYAEENISTLTDDERALIYTTATSDDQTELRRVLAGLDLTEMGMPEELATVEMTAETEDAVAQILSTNGYPDGSIDMLTQAEIASIYTIANSGDETELRRVLQGLQLAQAEGAAAGTMEADTSEASATADGSVQPDSTEAVITYLQERGYTQEQIDGLTDGDMASIYTAITSDDEAEIDRAIEAAINS